MSGGAIHEWTPSAWWLLAAAVPVLLLGDFLVANIKPLAKCDLPPSIVGGLVIALIVLLINLSGSAKLNLANKVTTKAWNWIITPETQLKKSPAVPIYLPLSTAFFCCVGLNASWSVAKKGSWQLLLFLGLATFLGVLQNILGIAMCRGMHQNPLLGLICGSVTLTGGPSTALGLASKFQEAGFAAADVVGAAAAMFGIVAASLLAGAFGGYLIRTLKLRPTAASAISARSQTRTGFVSRVKLVLSDRPASLKHFLVILICMKLGAWISYGLNAHKINLPVYMGGMILAILWRNITDQETRFKIQTETVQAIASVCLGLFLVMAMSSLNLMQLKSLAVPMLAILIAQVLVMLVFALAITFVIMGRDYDAAVISAGHVGFGLGITPNAVATMDILEQKFGPSPRAILIVTIVGGFLIDITNNIIITLHMNYLQR
jgi:glutamate:Na+ symporter, ESS family